MNALPKFVATTTLKSLKWNAPPLEGDVAEAVAALKQREGSVLVYGSGALARTLLKHGLVDELRLLIHPLVLGSGKRLFSDGERLALQLIFSREMGGGAVLLTYQPAGA